MEKNNVGILTFETYHGRKDVGSSRIRGHWLVKHWPGAELFKMGQKYDVVIYQKAYWVEHAREFKGVKILDICDPDFLDWRYRTKEMIEEVDAITTSSEALAEIISKFTDKPVKYIPDRVDLEFYRGRKCHAGIAKWVVWFGYNTGFEILKPVLHFLKKYNLGLIVISDIGFCMPSAFVDYIELKNFTWNIETVNQDIMSGDIVINPQSKTGKWKYKSLNKTYAAWALGMPVAHDVEELERFLDPIKRQEESALRLKEIKEKYDVRVSVDEFKKLISEINISKQDKNI
jgi:hypothetical protein